MKTPEDEAFEEIERIQRTRTKWVPVKKPQDEIMEMAKQAGWQYAHGDSGYEPLWDFAKLVAEAEREACAEICKKHADVYAMLEQNPTTKAAWAACIDNLDAIRARGEA
jgi:hypothetical protein